MKKKRLVLAGIEGKMGSFLLKGLNKEKDLKVVAGIGRTPRMKGRIPVYSDLDLLIKEVEFDIYIDFTVYDFALEAIGFMLRAGKPVVVGTTGFSEQDILDIQALALEAGGKGVIAPNFSIGAILLNQFAKMCGEYFKDFTVLECHHASKKDNPSGTALYIGGTIDKSLGAEKGTTPIYGVRLPGVLATHHVIVSDETQKLELIHQSNNRHSFEQGVVLAISKLDQLDGVIYGLEHALKP